MANPKSDPAALRGRIENCQREVARMEGQEAALLGEIERDMTELRKVLGCEPGKEADAVRALRAEVESNATEVEALLTAAEDQHRGTP